MKANRQNDLVSVDFLCLKLVQPSNVSMPCGFSLEDIAVFNEIPESLRIVMHEELYRDFFRAAHIFSGFHVPLLRERMPSC